MRESVMFSYLQYFFQMQDLKNLGEPIFGIPKYSRSGRKLRQRERAMILSAKLFNLRKVNGSKVSIFYRFINKNFH